MEERLKKQILKKIYFASQDQIFNNKKFSFTTNKTKTINRIFTQIANKPQFNQIRKRYKLEKLLSKILLPKHLHYVLYAYYRDDKLTIAVSNHIGQNELNLQKLTLMKFLKQIDEYKMIKNVSIFRDEEFALEQQTKSESTIEEDIKFSEKSYGIFENNLKDKKLYNLVESIRKSIKQK
jgi:hypothetical protein